MDSAKTFAARALALVTLFVVLAFWARPAAAESPTIIATVTSSEAQVRADADTTAAIVTTLRGGSVVAVMGVKGSWAQVGWLDKDGKLQQGWIPTAELKVKYASGAGSTYTSSGGAIFRLSVGKANLDCRDDLLGKGYESCSVTIPLSYTSDYNGNDTPNVGVNCEANLALSDSKGWPSTKTDSESHSFYGAHASGSVEIEFRLITFLDPIVKVRISDVSCRIRSVY
jgi:hypothetical protein